ncbi:GIY-YIG nuclease family protein [Aquabacterium sp. A7-Y]|uniref:GIY-YIG nuclease family protein n=1 Tax=Aquabacterium sp. A7-Y TaxID=1349605 RepID=UPI00223DEBF1|nr:GIY-YIG nuclease family protein [Aquabacterium sp. A7-Y]MCW7538535.1 GIY-YIG nuclease family protein [Aquabacterium sp. A7-Y]
MNRRKELKQQYKETPRAMGVCRVFNRGSGLSLVESGRDVHAILNRHLAELKLGTHRVKQLQNDWNTLGADMFSFEIVELLKPLDKPDYDPGDDLDELLALTLQREEYAPEKLYKKP